MFCEFGNYRQTPKYYRIDFSTLCSKVKLFFSAFFSFPTILLFLHKIHPARLCYFFNKVLFTFFPSPIII